MITAANRVGRLVESRFVPPLSLEEIEAFENERAQLATRIGEKRVTVIDVSRVTTLPPQLIDRLIASLRRPVAPALRSAMLMSGSATFALQMSRLNRETEHPTRRTFTDARELEAWLADALDPSERARLTEFLAGH